jgi:hypothetical protein
MDTPDKGHLFKSRANQSFVLYNRLTGEGDTDSYEIDIPNGGLAVIVGNMVEKPASSGNGTLIAYAEEGLSNPDNRIFVVNNTLVNDKGGGTFIGVSSGTLVAHNNLLVGPGTPSSTGALSADNLATMTPGFVDQAGFDYHLLAGSPAIDVGVDPGSADAFSLTPTDEYVQPTSHVARGVVGALDLGAFEFGTDTMGTGGGSPAGAGGGTATGTGTGTTTGSSTGPGSATGVGTGTGAGTGPGAGSGGASAGAGGSGSGDSAQDTGGCGCRLAADEHTSAPFFASIALALAALARGRRRRAA